MGTSAAILHERSSRRIATMTLTSDAQATDSSGRTILHIEPEVQDPTSGNNVNTSRDSSNCCGSAQWPRAQTAMYSAPDYNSGSWNKRIPAIPTAPASTQEGALSQLMPPSARTGFPRRQAALRASSPIGFPFPGVAYIGPNVTRSASTVATSSIV